MARSILTVQTRALTGKKVAQMRRSGILPGNVFGRGLDSISVQIATDEFEKTLKTSRANEVLDMRLGEDQNLRPVVIHRVQRHPITTKILHADFFQVSLEEKMRAEVPLVLTGTSEAVKTYNGVVVTGIESLSVEALPLDIVAEIEVDMTRLAQLEDAIHVRDLNVPPALTVLNDPDVVVVKVATPRVAVETTPSDVVVLESETPVEAAEEASSEPAEEAEAEES